MHRPLHGPGFRPGGGRRAGASPLPAQALHPHPLDPGQLQPQAAPGGRLPRQRPLVACRLEPPGAGRQPQGAGRRRQRLELHRAPALPPPRPTAALRSPCCRARSRRRLARRRASRHWGSACSNTSGIAVPGRMSWNCWNSRVRQSPSPCAAAAALSVGACGPHPEQGDGQIGFPQQPLQGAVVALLIRTAGGAAAVQLQIELIPPHRQLPRQGRQRFQVGPQGAVPLARGHGLRLPEGQLLEHLGGGPAAVVPHPRQPEGIGAATGALPLQPVTLHRHRVAVRADRRRHQGQQLGAAAAAPAEQAMGKGVGGVPGQLVGAEPAHPRGGRHRRQPGGETEAVRQPGQLMAPLREAAQAVVLALLELAQQRSGAHQHTVVLHPGAVEGLPAAGPHRLADTGEQGRPVALQPGVQRRGGMAEVERPVALHQLQGRGEGAFRRLPGVGHRPQPGQIEMGMAQHLQHPFPRGLVAAMRAAQGAQRIGGRREQAVGIGGIQGFQLDPALDQGTVVMQRTAQPQLQLQGLPLPPAGGQRPAAGGVEEITAVDGLPIHPQFGPVGPPAQRQAGTGDGGAAGSARQVQPGLRAGGAQAEPAPLTAPRPDDQAPGGPVGPVGEPPGAPQGRSSAAPGLKALPARLKILRPMHGERD